MPLHLVFRRDSDSDLLNIEITLGILVCTSDSGSPSTMSNSENSMKDVNVAEKSFGADWFNY